MMRAASARLAIAACAAAVATACASARTMTSSQPVRIMSYNIQYGGGGGNLDSIIGVIRTAGPDIVGLQEVDVHWAERSAFIDQASTIARTLGMELRYAPIYDFRDSIGGRPPRQFGLALLSRYPIVDFANRGLTRLSTQDSNPVPRMQPGFLEATIDVRGSSLRVFNTHLDFRRDPAVRRQQVTDMLGWIGTSAVPTVLLGDLNAPPEAPELQPLFARLRDSWPVSAGTGFTVPVTDPARRIDYVLVSEGLQVRRAWVPVTTASDHRPMVVEVFLPEPRR
jgi:endonuclease/exonuclease/phosphatase family metal-dependent hydrolase